ncbi:MAG: glycosyl hydrolase family 98, partial [Bacteroidaceae bacterium]|nr:glycosyl hydrolase family 98 [Bacteroidaceae bacterium]
SGYTQGMMAGYYLSVYNNGANTEFRVYKSTAARTLAMINSTSVPLSFERKQSVWYRASVSGTQKVTLKLEYSFDGENWELGTATTDDGGMFQMGATQFVWGLAASKANFHIDDIVFKGITFDESVTAVRSIDSTPAEVLREECYDMAGRRVQKQSVQNGIVIIKQYMGDGTVQTKKVMR